LSVARWLSVPSAIGSIACLACTSTARQPTTTSGELVPVPTFWSEALDAGAAAPFYSFDFEDGAPPFILVHFPIDDPQVSCDALMAELHSAVNQWYLTVGFQPSPTGSAAVGGNSPAAISSGMAVVALTHLDDRSGSQSLWKTFAVDGTLTVSAAPATTAQQDAGALVQGHLSAIFEDDPVDTVDCGELGVRLDDGSFLGDGGTCTCEDGNGDSFACQILRGQTSPASCCDGGTAASGRYTLSFAFSAAPCGALCGGLPQCVGL
jgi:hypothetical protein